MNYSKTYRNINSIAKLFIIALSMLALFLIQCKSVQAQESNDVHNQRENNKQHNSFVKYASKEQDDTDKPDIVLVRRYSNWAWGYCDYGIFIDEDGNIYSFDFGNSVEGGYPAYDDVPGDDELLEILGELQKTTKPMDKASKLVVFLCDLLAEVVDLDAEFTYEHTACDAGQDTLYVVNNLGQLVEISSYGDNTTHRKCPVANKIDILYNLYIEDITF